MTVFEGDITDEFSRAFTSAGIVAVDTETSGLDWKQDRLELCQLFSPATGAVLIRPGAGKANRLANLMADGSVIKVFHYAPFDLRFLGSQWKLEAASVRCTKAAAKLLFPALSAQDYSLAPLVARHLGVHLDKGSVRTSDWAAAELSSAQLRYAADDVEHLLDLYEVLDEQLRTKKLDRAFQQVCAYMPVDAYLAINGFADPLRY